jgi:sugar phosphate isomerase/epimerase
MHAVSNWIYGDEPLDETVSRLARLGYNGIELVGEPGRGHTDFAALLRALEEIGYEGALVLEPVPPGSDPLLAARMPENAPLREIYARVGIETLMQVERSMGRLG